MSAVVARRVGLRVSGALRLGAACLSGGVIVFVWMHSDMGWERHRSAAYAVGLAMPGVLAGQSDAPPGVRVQPLTAAQQDEAEAGRFARLSGVVGRAFVTQASFGDPSQAPGGVRPSRLRVAAVSADLTYPVSAITDEGGPSLASRMAGFSRVLASYCSDPVVFARLDARPWVRVDAPQIWGCETAPRDWRLLAVLAGAVLLGALWTQISATASQFQAFSTALRSRPSLGGPEAYASDGPAELHDIVDAVNVHLSQERARLAERALVLSGVSHDLGTPATRLRLRTALIEDDDLRGRLEADIDKMTAMIESVLTYTQSELASEPPQTLSLASLIDAVVDDYADLGQPVAFTQRAGPAPATASSVFGSARREGATGGSAHTVLVQARPIALRRALTNLIDNALKYGRRAELSLIADARHARIVVQDAGGRAGMTAEALNALVGPFQRGANAGSQSGSGLGLTVVSAIAAQHGGGLSFEESSEGMRAVLTLARS